MEIYLENNDYMSGNTNIMKEILELLFKRCDFESVVNFDCSRLWLSYRYGGIMLELECNEYIEKKYSFKRVGSFDIEEFCNDINIGNLYITDPAPYTEEVCADYEMSCKMFQMVKFIKSKYPTAIRDYYVCDFLMDPYIMEGENLWNSYFIEISESLKADRRFISDVVAQLEKHQPIASSNQTMFQGLDIIPRYDLNYLTTNTKVRRLGYFKLILSLFKETSLLLDKPFLKNVEELAIKHETELLNYKSSKGIIKQTKTGSGAKPYVEVIQGLKLIAKVGNGYELGKVSRAYNALSEDSSSFFVMGLLDRAFFLESILRYDYLYIYTLLEYAYTAPYPSYNEMKLLYQQMLLKNLRQMKEDANRADSIKKYNLQTVEKRIKEWKKPEIYLEHVLMPRLNWLFDLDLLVLHENLSFELTKAGEKLFMTICGWRDINGISVVDPAPYLDANFMKLFAIVYSDGKIGKMNEIETDQYISEYLEDSFRLFKTFAPNRVTFSVFTNYAKWKLYKNTTCAIDIDDIVKGFLRRNSDKYIFKFQKFYNDGYIQKVNK